MTAWVRHGQSTWNALGRNQGHIAHPPLTHLGRRQAEHVAALLAARRDVRSHILTSPAVRAQQTAEIVAATLRVPVVTSSLLLEQDPTEPDSEVLVRLTRLVQTEQLTGAVVVSHGETIRLAGRVFTGHDAPVPRNGVVLELPPRPAEQASTDLHPVSSPSDRE